LFTIKIYDYEEKGAIDLAIGEIDRKLCNSGWRVVEGNVSVARAIEVMLVKR